MPLQKLNKNNKTVVLYLLLVLVEFITTLLFVLPIINMLSIILIYAFIHLGMGINFLLSLAIAPGYLEPHPKYDFQDLMNKIDPIFLCPDCNVIRTPRSRHCNLCNRWVERYDHHCPYINNWVGYRNHLFFTLFLFFVWTVLVFQIIITSMALTHDFEYHPWGFMRGFDSKVAFTWFAVVEYLICGFFVIPVFLLLVTHLINFMMYRTTHERYSNNKIDPDLTMNGMEYTDPRTSIFNSILKSEILIQESAEIDVMPSKLKRLRTSNDSIVDEDNKMALIDGHYINEMDYTKMKKKNSTKCGWRNICRMIWYKPPNQAQAKKFVLEYMK